MTALFYDSTWRGVVDFAVGAGACVLLAMLPWAVGAVLGAVHTVGAVLHIDVLRAWVDWLMVLPAGLKLNHFAGKKSEEGGHPAGESYCCILLLHALCAAP